MLRFTLNIYMHIMNRHSSRAVDYGDAFSQSWVFPLHIPIGAVGTRTSRVLVVASLSTSSVECVGSAANVHQEDSAEHWGTVPR